MVKTYPAENTAWATVWEGRWLPIYTKAMSIADADTEDRVMFT